jgi:tetratricopeptide (TPR) repeat protein/CHAT domain-containing protein
MKITLIIFLVIISTYAKAQQTKDETLLDQQLSEYLKHNKAQNYDSAVYYLESAYEIAQLLYTNKDGEIELIVYNLGLGYCQLQQFEKAEEAMLLDLIIIKNTLGKNHANYGVSLNNLAKLYKTLGDYDKALPLYLEGLNNTKKSLGKDHSSYGIWLNNLALLYEIIGDYEKAMPLYLEALENAKKNLGKNHHYYGAALNNLAELFNDIGDYDKAISLSLEALENAEESLGKNHPDYGNRLNILAGIYQNIGNYTKALPLYLEALRNTEKSLGKDHRNYGNRLNNLALLYANMGEHNKALPLYLEALANTEKSLGKDHSSYGAILSNLALLCVDMGDYSKALPLYLEALANTEKSLGKDHSDYGIRLSNLAGLYEILGEYNKALPLYLEALANTEKSLGKEHSNYGTGLNNLALLYKILGEYNKALPLYLQALENIEKSLGTEHSDYGTGLNNLAGLYEILGENEKALLLALEALENTKKSLGKDHYQYGMRLSNLAHSYWTMGEYDKALPLYLEALSNIEKYLGKNHSSYGVCLNNLASLYADMGEYNKALSLHHEALENTEKSLGKDHSAYGIRLSNLAGLYWDIKEYKKSFSYYLSDNENLVNQINQIFSFRSEKEKKVFLNTVFHNFDIYQSFGYVTQNQFSELTEMNLNNQLLLKGLLLNSSKEVLEKLSVLGDREIDTKILELRSNKTLINKEYSLASSKQSLNTDSLSDYINTQEVELVRIYSKRFGEDVTLTKDWKEVQKQLKNNELAIEFSHFDYRNNKEWTDSTLYVAYLMKKEWEDPKVVYLFEEEQLKSIIRNKTPNTLYSSSGDSLYNLIWKPLEEHLDGLETVYYSVDGLLHQLSFAAVAKTGEASLSQQYNLVQLSSTATLVNQKKVNTTQDFLLVGGVDYSYNTSSMEKPEEITFSLLNTSSIKRSATTHSRGENWTYLPGTKKEVDLIQNLTATSKNVTVLSGTSATEESLKKLSGNSPDVLHIATHGYFFENPKQDEKRMQGEANTYKIAEDPLLRSGLLLAGGNYAWVNEGNPFEEEDGILTSLEISNLDLKNTELVVLSACETGLGDIEGNEGVYGLYRAFKMAGVESIIMSLWKIPDNETTEFMELFYTNWMKGNTIRAAFNSIQQTMQTKYANEPYKWAAFVLID